MANTKYPSQYDEGDELPMVTITGHRETVIFKLDISPQNWHGFDLSPNPPGANLADTQKPCVPALTPQNRIDKAKVFEHEGFRPIGYVVPPVSKYPKSGVTIGYGFDLGSKTKSQLIAYGISDAGLNALVPFLGLKGEAAETALQIYGKPTISQADALKLSNTAFNDNIAMATRQFNAVSTRPFDTLPANIQTVIADIAYTTPNLQAAAPTFFNQITRGDWAGAVKTLRNWAPGQKDQLEGRHKEDAQKIQDDIDNNLISPDSNCSA